MSARKPAKPKPRAGAQKPRQATKTPEKSSGTVALIPQPHGGALQVGNPGNAGGPGRPADRVRTRLAGSYEKRIPVLEDIADGVVWLNLREKCEHCGEEPTKQDMDALLKRAVAPTDQIRAMREMGDRAFPKQVEGVAYSDALSMAEELAEAVRRRVPPEHYSPELAAELSAIARRRMPHAE